METRRNQLFTEIQAHVSQMCRDFKLDEAMCEMLGGGVADFLAANFAGQTIYFPCDHYYKKSARNMAIYRKFNGTNIAELSIEFGMTESGIRKAIARVRKYLKSQKGTV